MRMADNINTIMDDMEVLLSEDADVNAAPKRRGDDTVQGTSEPDARDVKAENDDTAPRIPKQKDTDMGTNLPDVSNDDDTSSEEYKTWNDDERIRSSAPGNHQAVKMDPRPVSEQVKAYYGAQARDSVTDESSVNDDAVDTTSKGASETRDDDRIQRSDGNDEAPTARGDPRPVSEQVKAYYEYMSQRDSNATNEATHDSVDITLPETGTESVTPGQSGDADGPEAKETVSDNATVTPMETEELDPSSTKALDDTEINTIDAAASTDTDTTANDGASEKQSGEVRQPESPADNDSPSTLEDISNEKFDETEASGETLSEEDEMASRTNINAPDDSTVVDDMPTLDETTSNESVTGGTDSVPSTETDDQNIEVPVESSNATMLENDDLPRNNTTDETDTPSGRSSDSTSEGEPTTEKTGSASNETMTGKSDVKAGTNAEMDEDVIDFDVIDGEFDSSPGEGAEEESTKEEATPEASDSRNRARAYSDGDVIDFDIIDREYVESVQPATDEATSEKTNPGNDLSPNTGKVEKGDAAAVDGSAEQLFGTRDKREDSSTEPAPEKDSLAEHSEGESAEEAIDVAAKATSAPEESAQANPIGDPPPIAEKDSKEESSTSEEEEGSGDATQYSGGWGFGKQAAPRTTTLPDYLSKPLAGGRNTNASGGIKANVIKPEVESSPENVNTADVETGEEDTKASANNVESNNVESKASFNVDTTEYDDRSMQSEPKSVNSEFVEGLDDLDKFFQSVDPPDELDVGAAGSSIQEVLVGQSVQIVLKRVKLGYQFVRTRLSRVKMKIDALVSRRTTKDGEVALVTREDVQSVIDNVKRLGRRVIKGIQGLVDDFIGDDDFGEDTFDLESEEFRAKIEKLVYKEQKH